MTPGLQIFMDTLSAGTAPFSSYLLTGTLTASWSKLLLDANIQYSHPHPMGTPYLQIPLVYQYNPSTLLLANPGPQAPLLPSWLSLKFTKELNVHTQLGEGKET